MPYEKFSSPKKSKIAAPRPPQVKVLKGGIVSLNASAYKQFLQGAKHLELFYDSSVGKIGLKPKKYVTKAGFPIKAVGKGKATYRVNIKPLFKQYGIEANNKRSVEANWDESEGMLVIEL